MPVIDFTDPITPHDQLKRRRGKPSERYAYINAEVILRDLARRIVEGELKSAHAVYKDDRSRRYLERRWSIHKPTLLAGAKRTLELEQRGMVSIGFFDPKRQADIGTHAGSIPVVPSTTKPAGQAGPSPSCLTTAKLLCAGRPCCMDACDVSCAEKLGDMFPAAW